MPTSREPLLIRLLPGSALALACLLAACGAGEDPASVQENPDGSFQVLAGQAEKGPLLRGSSVTINTLTTAPVSVAAGTTPLLPGTVATVLPALVPSGASFSMEVKDDHGSFAPQSAAIFQSNFIETTVQGYYLNELTGRRAEDQIALRGLSNLKSDKAINVNLLTDLSKERTLKLARTAAGSAAVTSAVFDSARRQAQSETLRAFGIDASELGSVAAFGEMDLKRLGSDATARPADQILLALSALAMQVGQDGGGVSDFVNRFEADLADNGVIDGAALKAQILQASATVDLTRVAANMNAYYGSSLFNGDALAQWVDRSGGVIGLIGKNVQFTPDLTFSPGTVYTSRTLTVAAAAVPACYGAEVNDARYGTAQLLNNGAVVANGQKYPLNTTTAAPLALRFTPSDPNAVAYLVRWDAVSGSCSLTSQPNKVRLQAYAAVTPDVARFLNKLSADFAKCFALPVTSRVLSVDNSLPMTAGGPQVTSVAPVCEPLASRKDVTGVDFLQNGYSAGQYYHAMLHDGSLTKSARITQVSVLRTRAAGVAPMTANPTLVVNVKYVDRYNRLGNFVSVAQRFSGTSAESGDWWITGNQQPVDVNLVPFLRKFTSLANYTTATPTIKEHFRSALGVFITAGGPGSRAADGTAISAVRVSADGMQSLVYVPPVQAGQTWMDLSNTGGDVAGAAGRRCGATVGVNGPVSTNCPIFWVARTTPVLPSAAAPVLRTPGSTEGSCATAASVTQTCAWGGTWSAQNISSTLTMSLPFKVEIFYGGRTTPTHTYTKYLNSPFPDLTRAHLAGWVALDSASLVAARPLAGQTEVNLAWTGQVANSVEVKSATVSLNTPGASIATPDEAVLRGSTSVLVAPGAELQYSTPTSYTGTNQRALLLNLRTWDGSSRSVWTSYDTAN